MIANPEGTQPVHVPVARDAKRRADVLQAEVGQGYITQAEADAAKQRAAAHLAAAGRAASAQPPHRRGAGPPAQRPAARRRRRRSAATRLLKGGLKITPPSTRTCRTMADDAATERAARASPAGPDWGSSLVAIDPPTGAVKAMSRTSRLRRQPVQHRHPCRRPPTRIDVEGDHARRRAGQRLLAERHRRTVSDPCSVPKFFGNATTINSETARAAVNEPCGIATAGSVNCAFVRLSTSVGPGQGDGHGPQDGHHPAAPVPAPHALDR